ncbi:MAG: hypothetical protein V4614_12715 [Pseudomonadota bacterium]
MFDRLYPLISVYRRWVWALALVFASLIPTTAFASACTAMWGIGYTNNVTTNRALFYFNSSTNRWITTSVTIAGVSPNSLAGDPTTGNLYYVSRSTGGLRRIDVNTMTEAAVGTVPVQTGFTTSDILGATMDSSGRLFLYATRTSAAPTQGAFVAQISTTTGATVTSWTMVRTTGAGVTPTLGGSGDIFIDQGGVAYISTNSTPNRLHQIDLTPGASFGRTVTPSLVVTGVVLTQLAGASVDPATGLAYVSSQNSGSITYVINPTTGVATLRDNSATATYAISDAGNCIAPPNAPTINKSFTDTYESGGVNNTTTTVTITFGNSNTTPIWLMQNFTDSFPTNMRVYSTPGLTTSCTGAPAPVATAGATSVTWASGGRIPAGGCSMTFAVTATASLTPYVNTIPAGSLTTTAGTNTLAAQATLTVGTDFSASKVVRTGTTGPLGSSVSTSGGQTLQYVLTIANSSTGGTGSATFTDSLPVLITPVLSITAVHTGGGSCTTQTSVVGGATVLIGTLTNALAGSTCTITVTAQGSATAVATTFINTVTLAAVSSTADPDPTDNTGTATVTLTAVSNLTIVKTNGLAGTVVAGSTVIYTITVANLGPANATPSFVSDATTAGLNCTTVTCSAAGGGTCPATNSSTIAYLSGAAGTGNGIQLNTFNSGHILNFLVTCGVTATGQ